MQITLNIIFFIGMMIPLQAGEIVLFDESSNPLLPWAPAGVGYVNFTIGGSVKVDSSLAYRGGQCVYQQENDPLDVLNSAHGGWISLSLTTDGTNMINISSIKNSWQNQFLEFFVDFFDGDDYGALNNVYVKNHYTQITWGDQKYWNTSYFVNTAYLDNIPGYQQVVIPMTEFAPSYDQFFAGHTPDILGSIQIGYHTRQNLTFRIDFVRITDFPLTSIKNLSTWRQIKSLYR